MLSTAEWDGHVEVCVADTGAGMSDEVRSRIFDPFFTTKGKAGMGLGLAVSFGIISRHQGTIEVNSVVGCGTTFRIRIPVATVEGKKVAAGAKASLPPAPVTPAPQCNGISILVVDDEEDVRELLRDILESEGCRVAAASGGREALSLFDRGNFDAVFTDIGMPGMSGWELARAIRERDRQIPLAVITGWGDAVGSDAQQKAGVDWVVTKPFKADRVAELARDVSRRRDPSELAAARTAAPEPDYAFIT
jgi:CheY-like chemotaxis protein